VVHAGLGQCCWKKRGQIDPRNVLKEDAAEDGFER
jgi:hypothetical protein